MMKSIIGATAAFVLASGAAMANDCVLEAEAPVMPDPKTATAEDRAATIAAIKDYQAKLGEYRECVTAISDNVELDIEVLWVTRRRWVQIGPVNAAAERRQMAR